MKKTTLYFTDGKSDEVYSAWLKPFDNDLYDVAIEYGRRGGNLAGGIKTPDSLPLADAQKVLDRIIAEKMAKGYTQDAGGNPFNGDAEKLAEILPHPRKEIVTLQTMRNFSKQDFLLQRKFDGILDKFNVAGADILCEWMKRKSGGFYTLEDEAMFAKFPNGWRTAITVAAVHGENVLTKSTRERWGILCSFEHQFPADMVLCRMVEVPDKLTTEEGYVAHAWGDSWGNMFAVKQEHIYLCHITKIGGTQSVGICDAETSQDRGNVKAGGGKCDQMTVGSLIRVAGMGLTAKGLIRQPTLCREWKVNP